MSQRTGSTFLAERAGLRKLERALTTCLVVLKLWVLHGTWGRIQGFDAYPWLEVFHATRWFHPLPGSADFFNSYHPPLSYLLGQLLYAAYPHDLLVSQILSTAAMIVAVFALRSALVTIGVLWSAVGLAFFYTALSMPLLVWMSIETSYDALVFMWFALTLAISVRLFWRRAPEGCWRRPRYLAGVALLGAVLAAGLATKFNALVNLGLPFLVIAIRRRYKPSFDDLWAASAAVFLGVAAVVPLYYQRYYVALGQVFPQPIEWLRASDLHAALAQRDADPWGFWRHVLRIPEERITGTQEPVTDSFFHSIWLQLWKRDIALGEQSPLSMRMSDLYLRFFAVALVGSTVLFLARRRRLSGPWRDLGDLLFALSMTYCGLLLYFGWRYPMWDWRVFKAKYISPVAFWIAYCVVLPFLARPRFASAAEARPAWARDFVALGDAMLLFFPIVFMFVNHLVPVY